MELNELKSEWKKAGSQLRSEEDLVRMTKIVNHPVIKRIKTKLIIQLVILLMFLFVYYDWFDGDKKPIYANLALITGLLLYVINDIIGYTYLTKPVGEANLKQSVLNYLARIKRLSFFSLMVTVLYSSSILIFFTSTIVFTKEKAWVLLFSVVIIFQLILFSSRLWSRWLKKLDHQIKDLNMDDQDPVGV